MDPITLLSAMSAVFSIAGSVFSITREVGYPLGDLIKDKVKGYINEHPELDEQTKAYLESDKVARVIENTGTINPALLAAYREQVKNCITEHVERIKRAEDNGEFNYADDKAEHCVCNILRRIKRFNEQQFPDDEYEEWWRSYNCVG